MLELFKVNLKFYKQSILCSIMYEHPIELSLVEIELASKNIIALRNSKC